MKDKFIIEVSNELDSEYIQKLAFKAGYKWSGVEDQNVRITDARLLLFNSHQDGFITHSQDHSFVYRPVYSFPSQASEIVALFTKKQESFKEDDWIYCLKELRMESDDRVEATKGKVYKCIGSGGCSYSYIDNSGIRHGMAYDGGYFRLATKEEIEAHLISEAEKKGFVKGAKVKAKGYDIRKCYSDKGFVLGDEHWHFTITGYIVEVKVSACGKVVIRLNEDNTLFLEASSFCLIPSHPEITINNYKAGFHEWGISFNNGCAKIGKELFLSLYKILCDSYSSHQNKGMVSVKIGAGEFTVSQIKEIAEYYKS